MLLFIVKPFFLSFESVILANISSQIIPTRRVPYLRLDRLPLDIDRPRGKLHTDGGLGLEVELVLAEAREEVALAHARVAHQDNLRKDSFQFYEQKFTLILLFICIIGISTLS